MANSPTWSDIFDNNPKTGALRLGKNRLDDYATKYLSQHCPEALKKPMPLPVEKILEDEHLTVIEASLSANLDIFGCCLLLDADVPIYNKVTGKKEPVRYPAGTILIDPESVEMYGVGARRNTLIHEALHWEKDKTYFEILALRSANVAGKLYPIMCRHKEKYLEPSEKSRTKENEVKWLEWQAHRLAPRVLMPFETFKQKALAFIEKYRKENTTLMCDKLVDDLSEFFLVSRSSAKYRLLEVGLKDVLVTFDDYENAYAEVNQREEFVPLTPSEAFNLIEKNKTFWKWIQKDCFIFADGYFVIANPKYVRSKNGTWHLTKTAKKNLPSCVINITELRYTDYKNVKKDFGGYAILPRMSGVDKRLLTFHPEYQSKLNANPEDLDPEGAYKGFGDSLNDDDDDDDDNENKLRMMLANQNMELCQCLWFMFEKRGWKYPKNFCDATHLHSNYFSKIKNNEYNNMGTKVLMPICVGLKLRARLVEKIFDKSDAKLHESKEPDKTYMKILDDMPGLSIDDFNGILRERNLEELGTQDRDKKLN